MSIFNTTATASRSTEAPSEGNHAGALVALIDLGTHTETYKDKNGGSKTSEVHKIFLVFELDEKAEGMKGNHVIGKECTLTTSPQSKLRQIMEAMRGKSYAEGEQMDISKAVGKSALVNIKHGVSAKTGNAYGKFEGVSPLPKGMPAFKPTYPVTVWEIGSKEPFPDHKWLPFSFLNGVPAPLKLIVDASKEMREGTAPKPPGSNGTQHTTTAPTNQDADEEEKIPF